MPSIRRLYPDIQLLPGSLSVAGGMGFSFNPVNCLYNLPQITLAQTYPVK